MIKTAHKNQWFECDHPGCSARSEAFVRGEFMSMLNAAQRAGWTIYKKAGQWVHYCRWPLETHDNEVT